MTGGHTCQQFVGEHCLSWAEAAHGARLVYLTAGRQPTFAVLQREQCFFGC